MSLRSTPPGQRELQLVPLTLDDLDTVWEMEKRAYTHPWSRLNFQDSLQSGYPAHMLTTPALPGDAVHPLTASGQLLLGYWVAMQVLDEVHLLNIAVAHDQHGRGHARDLLRALYVRCHQRRAEALWLEVRPSNQRARALYLREGFVDIGVRKHYYPAATGREDAVVMRREIGERDLSDPTEAPHALD